MKHQLKHFILAIALLFSISISTLTLPFSAHAADSPIDSGVGQCTMFLGLTSWNCGVNTKPTNTDALGGTIWSIVANIATDITVIAAYLVLGYVIYGGYLYIFAAGDVGKVLTGKKTLTQAFIGLAIVLSANIIMNTIRFTLLTNGGDFSACIALEAGSAASTNCFTPKTAQTLVTKVIQWVIGVAGFVTVIFVVIGAISYITSAGDPQKVQRAKNILVYSLIGLAIVALAEIGTAFVSNLIQNATGSNPSTSEESK